MIINPQNYITNIYTGLLQLGSTKPNNSADKKTLHLLPEQQTEGH
jgi:hypothetical protein